MSAAQVDFLRSSRCHFPHSVAGPSTTRTFHRLHVPGMWRLSKPYSNAEAKRILVRCKSLRHARFAPSYSTLENDASTDGGDTLAYARIVVVGSQVERIHCLSRIVEG